MNQKRNNLFFTVLTLVIVFGELQAMELVTTLENAVITGSFDKAKQIIQQEGTKTDHKDGKSTPLHVLLSLPVTNSYEEANLRQLTRLILPYAGNYWTVKNQNDLLPLDLFQPKEKHYCISDLIITTLYTYLEGIHNKNAVQQWHREENTHKQYELIKTYFSSNTTKRKTSAMAAFIARYDSQSLQRFLRYSPEPAVDIATGRTALHYLFMRDYKQEDSQQFLQMFKIIMPRMTQELLASEDCYGNKAMHYFEPGSKHAAIKNEIIDVCYEYLQQKCTVTKLDNDIRFFGLTKEAVVYQLLGVDPSKS